MFPANSIDLTLLLAAAIVSVLLYALISLSCGSRSTRTPHSTAREVTHG